MCIRDSLYPHNGELRDHEPASDTGAGRRKTCISDRGSGERKTGPAGKRGDGTFCGICPADGIDGCCDVQRYCADLFMIRTFFLFSHTIKEKISQRIMIDEKKYTAGNADGKRDADGRECGR